MDIKSLSDEEFDIYYKAFDSAEKDKVGAGKRALKLHREKTFEPTTFKDMLNNRKRRIDEDSGF